MIGYTTGQRKCLEIRGLCAGPAKATGRVEELVAVKVRKPVHGGGHEAKERKRLGQAGRVVRQRGPETGSNPQDECSQDREAGVPIRAVSGKGTARSAHEKEAIVSIAKETGYRCAVAEASRHYKTPELVLRGRKEGYDTLGQSKETTHGRCTTGTEW